MVTKQDKTAPPPERGKYDDPRESEKLNVKDILVDQNVQRPTYQARIDGMGDWEWGIAEAPTVIRRGNGELVAIEGQHRVLKLRQLDENARIMCVILEEGTDEAATALRIAKSRRAHSPLEQWNLRLKDGGVLEAYAEEVMAIHGVRFVAGKRPDGIAAVGAVEQVMRTYGSDPQDLADGRDLLDTVLSLLTGTWSVHEIQRLDGHLIAVLGRLIGRNEKIRLPRLAQVLGVWGPAEWLRKGKERHPSQRFNEALAKAITDPYNRGLSDANEISW